MFMIHTIIFYQLEIEIESENAIFNRMRYERATSLQPCEPAGSHKILVDSKSDAHSLTADFYLRIKKLLSLFILICDTYVSGQVQAHLRTVDCQVRNVDDLIQLQMTRSRLSMTKFRLQMNPCQCRCLWKEFSFMMETQMPVLFYDGKTLFYDGNMFHKKDFLFRVREHRVSICALFL